MLDAKEAIRRAWLRGRSSMSVRMSRKIAAFCRELADGSLETLAEQEGHGETFRRVRDGLRSDLPSDILETDLDALNLMCERVLGQGFLPADTRVARLPGHEAATGARLWNCPGGRCSGRGRVRPHQAPPICSISELPLVDTPLPTT
ncbi:hypothetical protein [Nonomuraea sp. GTA35]|uniref:hypothetical protein n=1 Tax=Nonomuraea sp. GTA35 TaxID=1676746 RepID=UPI0035BEF0EA